MEAKRGSSRLPARDRGYQRKVYEVQRLSELHHQILRFRVAGWHISEIARHLKITNQTVSNIINSELGRARLDYYTKLLDGDMVDVQSHIREIAPQALNTLEDIMLNPDSSDAVKTKVAMDLLDRAGHAPVKKTIDMTGFLDDDDIDAIKKRAKESGRRNGDIVEEPDIQDGKVVEEPN